MDGVRHVGDAERVLSRVEPSPARRLSIGSVDAHCRAASLSRRRVAGNNILGVDERATVVNLPRALWSNGIGKERRDVPSGSTQRT